MMVAGLLLTGFVLVGNNTRTCTGDGSSFTGIFDGEAAMCERELMQTVTVISLSMHVCASTIS